MRGLTSSGGETLLALAAAAVALVVVAWFDNTVLRDPQLQARTANVSPIAIVRALDALLVAGSVLLLGSPAWRSASLVAGLVYGVVGGFFAAQEWIWWNLAAAGNDVLPEAVALALRNLFHWSTGGYLNDVATIGAGMLIAGVATLVRWWQVRTSPSSSVEAIVPSG